MIPPPELPAGYRLVHYTSVGSTNDEAKRLARAGAPAQTCIWACEQTAGRGRRGRVWSSPPGNLYASLILRPDCPPSRAAQLGFVAALAIGGGLGAVHPGLRALAYKWPNDVLVNTRKIAGILLEAETNALARPAFLVVGVGVNLTSSPKQAEYPATSLAEEGRGKLSPARMLAEFCRCFAGWERCWREEGFAAVRKAWLANAASHGELIRVRLERETLYGRFLDIDEEGTLLLECPGGCHHISAGEVFPANF